MNWRVKKTSGKVKEAYIEKAAVKWAKLHGWQARKASWIGRRGCPDHVFWRRGRVVWVEFKRPGEKPRPDQQMEIDRMRDGGLEVHVIDDIDRFTTVMA